MNNGSQITYFAETDARNKRVKFGIKDEDRLRHIYSIGKTGMGKSTFLENMAIQDIQNGNGMAFLDPHGKTADLLLEYIPEHRIQDVVYFAPFDTSYPISFNVMEDIGPMRRHLVLSGLMSAFAKVFGEESFSDRMQYILQNTILALLEYPGATLLGINKMLSDKAYRTKVVDNITDPSVKSYWTKEFAGYTDRFAADAIPAIQNKVGQFTSNPLIRNIIGQPKSTFDIRKVMDEKKILIVNLSKGLVGENNANLLGSMLVTKIYLAAMSRADASPAELAKMPNFYLYVDEFQSFANKSFADILSEARKYKLSLNITHQYIEQMPEEVAAAVFGNVGTMISFRVGSHDAEVLAKEFAPVFTMEDLVNLSKFQIYLKLMIDNVASQPFSALTLGPIPPLERSFKEEVIDSSRKNYSADKEVVEKQITEWLSTEQEAAAREKKTETKPPAREVGKGIENKEVPKSIPSTEQKKEEQHASPIAEKKTQGHHSDFGVKSKPPEPQKKPEAPQEKKENVLAKALADALKEKNVVKNTETIVAEQKFDGQRIKVEQKKETISLQDLRHGDKNKNKGPSEQNMNALKEALLKAQTVRPASVPKPYPAPQSAPKAPPQPETAKPEPDQKQENKDHSAKGSEGSKDHSRGSKDHPDGPKDHSAKGSDGPKEVPEDVLRKILAGK